MDWNALRLFLAIADKGSLNGAASELDINHSTAFRRLKRFEEDIGSRLFERMAHGYELTTTGEELRERAAKVANLFEEIDRLIVGADIQPKGLVKITAPNSIAHRYLPAYLASFREQYPDIDFELLVSNQLVNMNSRQADIAVRATREPPEHLVGSLVKHVGWSAFASPSYIDQHGKPGNEKQLAEHQLIGGAGRMRSLPAIRWLEEQHSEQIHLRSDELTAMSSLAETGQGIAFLPDDQQRESIVRLFALDKEYTSQLWVLTHPDLRHAERIRLVMKHLRKCFEEETRI